MPILEYLPEHVSRFDSVVNANRSGDREQLTESLEDNIETISALIRESVKTVAKYTRQRSALEQVLRAVKTENLVEQSTF